MSYKKSSKSITQITPNWFPNGSLTSPQTTQENQFGSTRGLRYGPLRINKTGIFVNNGTLDSTIITDTGFHGFGLTGSEQITLDASTGVNVTDGTNSIFKAEISGTNVGDVTMGAYGSGAGVFYDKSAGSFNIKGTITAYSGIIGGWTIGSTTLSGTNITLDSAGSIKFFVGGVQKGQLQGSSAGAGGITNVSGDFAVDNNHSYLAKGTGSDYARFGVDGSNNTLLVSSSDYIQFLQNDGGSLATMGTASGGYPYLYIPEGVIQLKKMSAPSTPSADTVVIYLDVADEVLKAKDDAGNVHNLW